MFTRLERLLSGVHTELCHGNDTCAYRSCISHIHTHTSTHTLSDRHRDAHKRKTNTNCETRALHAIWVKVLTKQQCSSTLLLPLPLLLLLLLLLLLQLQLPLVMCLVPRDWCLMPLPAGPFWLPSVSGNAFRLRFHFIVPLLPTF